MAGSFKGPYVVLGTACCVLHAQRWLSFAFKLQLSLSQPREEPSVPALVVTFTA